MKEPTRIKSADFTGDVSIRWFEDGVLNASVSCLDRHLDAGNGDRVAIIWEGDNPDSDAKVTYRELHRRVCQLANAMRGMGVKKGDRARTSLPTLAAAAGAPRGRRRQGPPPRAPPARVSARQRHARHGREEGRPRLHLPADDCRGRGGH